MSGLTRTLTQTHRHYIADVNAIDVDEARAKGYPLVADCGEVWIPGPAKKTESLPLCVRCEVVNRRSRRTSRTQGGRDLRPNYVYRCYDANDRLIYVGCSVAPLQRMDQHKANSWWFDQVRRVRYVVFPDRAYALEMERRAIADENPRWNVRGRDRALWTVDDYMDAHTSMTAKGSAESRIHKLRLEALRRFDVDLTEMEASA